MKAITVSTAGADLSYGDLPDPVAADGQLLVTVQATGVNFSDLLFRQGVHPIAGPTVPGYDVAGTVTAAGPGTDPDLVGTRVVAPLFAPGSYAELAVVDAALAAALPDAVPAEDAVALPVQGLTALVALRDTAALRPGGSVLVTAAAGGVGHLAVQLARLLGADRVVGAASTPDKRALVRELGADDAVEVGSAPGRFDVVVDTAGGAAGRWAAGLLDAGGRIAVTAARTPDVAATPESLEAADDEQRTALAAGATLHRVPFLGVYAPAQLRTDLADLVDHLATRRLRVVTRDRWPLADAAGAHDAVAARRTTGKVVLLP